MNREALWVGLLCLAFGLGSVQLQQDIGSFARVQLAVGSALLLYGLARAVRGFDRTRRGTPLGSVYRAVAVVLAVIVLAVGAERLAAHSATRFDLTFEGQFEVAPATREALAELAGPVTLTIYRDPGDPRIRRTRLLLGEIAQGRDVSITTRMLENFPDDEDRYGIGSSNSVVVQNDENWTLVDRPTEGALFEAFARLGRKADLVLYITTGTGEGDIQLDSGMGFSGLAVGFQTEGFDVRVLASAVMSEIPDDADLVVVLGPQRVMRSDAVEALTRYVEQGGSLLAFIEPGIASGLEALLEHFGMRSPDALVVDPVSDPVDGEIRGLAPIVFNYNPHPVVEGLGRNRNTVFRRARAFHLRKPEARDELQPVVFTSPHAWLHRGPLAPGLRDTPPRPAQVRPGYLHLAAAARYPRGETEGRIVAFGDRDFASNRYLRALYNLDLVMNAAHWAVARSNRITLRPKSAGLIQFPVPIANSLKAFYGVGLLVPQLILVLGGIVWLRRHRA